MKTRPLMTAMLLTLAGCASAPTSSTSSSPASSPSNPATPLTGPAVPLVGSAVVAMAPASGSLVSGRLQATAMAGGVHFSGDIGGLAPGSTHGLHVHEVGDCRAADASSAGAHFNPSGHAHGGPQAGIHHAGDLPNITAGRDGVAHVDVHVSGLTLGGAPSANILGRALVVHAQADDYATQPSGNSGARIACGVVRTGP